MEPGTRMRLRALKLAEGFQRVKSYYDGRFENELGRIEHLLRTKEDVLAVSCEQMMDLTLDEAKEICREAAVPELLATRIRKHTASPWCAPTSSCVENTRP